jgi:hypothetical protein
MESGSKTTVIVNTALTLSGTPCNVTFVRGSSAGSRVNLQVLGETTDFNFVDMRDINAMGKALHFGAQSTVANQNNNNITWDPYDPGKVEGLGEDRLCQVFDSTDADSYTLPAGGFYGNEYTGYTWKKVEADNSVTTVASGVGYDAAKLDIRPYGYGKYSIDVDYSNGSSSLCRVSDTIIIDMTPPVVITSPFRVCMKYPSTVIADVTGMPGTGVKWYATDYATAPLPDTAVLVDGATYYVTRTVNGCESLPVAVQLKLINCNNKVYINPNLRLRVPY